MGRWAFATSRDGLGLTAERYWSLTPREIAALANVRDEAEQHRIRLWAIERAEFRNAHFLSKEQSTPWTVDDILRPDPAARNRRMREAMDSQKRMTQMNAQLGKMRKGDDHPLYAPGFRGWTDADLKKVNWAELSKRPE